MNTRSAFALGCCMIAGCLILGAFFGQPLSAQQPYKPPVRQPGTTIAASEPATIVGRYAVATAGAQNKAIVVVDTTTGRCWMKWTDFSTAQWMDLGSPVLQKSK